MYDPTNKIYVISRECLTINNDDDNNNQDNKNSEPHEQMLRLGLYSSESQALDAVIQLIEQSAMSKNEYHYQKFQDIFAEIKKSETFGQLNEILKVEAKNIVPRFGEIITNDNPYTEHATRPINMFGYYLVNSCYFLYFVEEVCVDTVPFKRVVETV